MNRSVEISLSEALLDNRTDPEPVEVVNADSQSEVLLICEHAGRTLPKALGSLGLSDDQLNMHIAWDIGAEQLARNLAERFECALVLQRYSRLVIDCNRPPGTLQSIPAVSDHVIVPANTQLTPAERRMREADIFEPFARACKAQISRPSVRHAYSIHSFTPQMDGIKRPWEIGFLYRHPASRGGELVQQACQAWPEITIGDNQPYSIEDETDWFVPVCAEKRAIPHGLIEVRNDLLSTSEGCNQWAARLHDLLSKFMEHSNETDQKPGT